MDTTSTLTATEVIDRVRDRPHHRPPVRAVEQLQLAVHWALLHPCPDDEYPAALGGRPRASTNTVTPWPVPVHRWSTEFAPATWPPPSSITLEPAGS